MQMLDKHKIITWQEPNSLHCSCSTKYHETGVELNDQPQEMIQALGFSRYSFRAIAQTFGILNTLSDAHYQSSSFEKEALMEKARRSLSSSLAFYSPKKYCKRIRRYSRCEQDVLLLRGGYNMAPSIPVKLFDARVLMLILRQSAHFLIRFQISTYDSSDTDWLI